MQMAMEMRHAASCDAQRRNARYGGMHGEDSPGYSGVVSGCSQVLSGTLRYSQVLCSNPSTPAVLGRTLRTGSARRERRSGRRKGTPPRPPADGATPASPSPGVARPSHARTHARTHACARSRSRASPSSAGRARAEAGTRTAGRVRRVSERAGGREPAGNAQHAPNQPTLRPIERTNNQTANSRPPAPPVPRTLSESNTRMRAQPHTRPLSPSSTRLNGRDAFMMMMHTTHGLPSPPLPLGVRMCGRHLARTQREHCCVRCGVGGAEVERERRGDDEAGGRHQRAERTAAAATKGRRTGCASGCRWGTAVLLRVRCRRPYCGVAAPGAGRCSLVPEEARRGGEADGCGTQWYQYEDHKLGRVARGDGVKIRGQMQVRCGCRFAWAEVGRWRE